MTKRLVRVVDDLYEDRDLQLETLRGPNGEPSRFDFIRFDLVDIMETVAANFDQLPEIIPGRPDCRLLATKGRLASEVAVVGKLSPDGVIDLVQLDLCLDALPATVEG